jgi:hypothetical protein
MSSFVFGGTRGVAALIGTCLFALAALFGPAGAGAETVSFSPGPEQKFVVPSGV